MTPRITLAIACALAALAVALGAFGAHAPERWVTAERLETWDTAVRYHFFHALGMAVLALWRDRSEDPWVRAASVLLLAGIGIFSGSLYLLVLLDVAWLGAITPIGGVFLISGWLLSAAAVLRSGRSERVPER
jgi:uncharacterized membrane protein YgdD (TMEM256/DUF423 family)